MLLAKPLAMVTALLFFAGDGATWAEGSDRPAFLRGMVVSCPRAGQIWGTEDMAQAVDELRELGVEWVAIHPYGWVRRDGTIRFQPAHETTYLQRAVEIIRGAGMKVFWKPHLGYWGQFEWRGAIAFGDDEAAWQRFFRDYQAFIVDHARFAATHRIPLFSAGVEYEKTVHREAEWRRVLAAVRAEYDGTITYAANWDGLERVPFWDAVDWIGVHAYFPLASTEEPSRTTLERSWGHHMATLGELSERHGDRPVLFAEIGYNRASDAAMRPWSYGSHDTVANRRRREELIEVALAAAENRDELIAGLFWWKWMPGRREGRDFSMKDEEARRALRNTWMPTTPSQPGS